MVNATARPPKPRDRKNDFSGYAASHGRDSVKGQGRCATPAIKARRAMVLTGRFGAPLEKASAGSFGLAMKQRKNAGKFASWLLFACHLARLSSGLPALEGKRTTATVGSSPCDTNSQFVLPRVF
jgi:hypothetical protein